MVLCEFAHSVGYVLTKTLTYKYRIKDKHAASILRGHAFQVNQIWNWCVAQHLDTLNKYRSGAKPRRWPSYYDLAKTFKGYGKEVGLHQQTIGAVCEQWSRNRSSKYRASYGIKRSLGWVPFIEQARQIRDNSVYYLGKRYRLFGLKRRGIPQNVKGGCFVEDITGKWYVCFHVTVPHSEANNDNKIGIDLGLNAFATLSDGRKIDAPRAYRGIERKLSIAQRAHNRKRVKALHVYAGNVRRDFHHKVSTGLCRDYAFIAVGNVNAKRLAQTRMAKSVLDAGWSTFRRMLAYKAATYREVDEKFTTQTCSECGSINGPKGYAGLNKREWNCSVCGVSHDRDVNSAVIILSRALSAERPVLESLAA